MRSLFQSKPKTRWTGVSEHKQNVIVPLLASSEEWINCTPWKKTGQMDDYIQTTFSPNELNDPSLRTYSWRKFVLETNPDGVFFTDYAWGMASYSFCSAHMPYNYHVMPMQTMNLIQDHMLRNDEDLSLENTTWSCFFSPLKGWMHPTDPIPQKLLPLGPMLCRARFAGILSFSAYQTMGALNPLALLPGPCYYDTMALIGMEGLTTVQSLHNFFYTI